LCIVAIGPVVPQLGIISCSKNLSVIAPAYCIRTAEHRQISQAGPTREEKTAYRVTGAIAAGIDLGIYVQLLVASFGVEIQLIKSVGGPVRSSQPAEAELRSAEVKPGLSAQYGCKRQTRCTYRPCHPKLRHHQLVSLLGHCT
jgi:hypothetical protein